MLKKKNKYTAEEEKKEEIPGQGSSGVKKASPAELRLKKEFSEIDLPPHATLSFPKEGDLMKFQVVIDLKNESECLWYRGKYTFIVKVEAEYPHKAPKVHLETPIYHPNIDVEGNVCLNILRKDWKPILGVNPIIMGLIFLFIEPNPEDPLNHDAAAVLRNHPNQFKSNVSRSLQGATIDGRTYPKMLWLKLMQATALENHETIKNTLV